jgi:hypothetical protein
MPYAPQGVKGHDDDDDDALTMLSQAPCHQKNYLHMMQGNRFH